MRKLIALLILSVFALSACTSIVQTQTVSSESFDINNWDSIVAAANGQTVNW